MAYIGKFCHLANLIELTASQSTYVNTIVCVGNNSSPGSLNLLTNTGAGVVSSGYVKYVSSSISELQRVTC